MMSARGFLIIVLISLAISSARAETALVALKALPKGAARQLARIEARDGTPGPERWHILVHDAQTENGLREYVVANGELAASREISQFAEALTSEDVIGAAAIKVDSDKAARKAQRYAEANQAAVSAMNYELWKDAGSGKAFWRVTCLTETGTTIGSVVIAASGGKVLSREGFALEPSQALAATGSSSNEEESRSSNPEARRESRPRATNANSRTRTATSLSRDPSADRSLEPVAEPPPVEVRRAERAGAASGRGESARRPSVIRRARQIVRGLLPF